MTKSDKPFRILRAHERRHRRSDAITVEGREIEMHVDGFWPDNPSISIRQGLFWTGREMALEKPRITWPSGGRDKDFSDIEAARNFALALQEAAILAAAMENGRMPEETKVVTHDYREPEEEG